MKHTAKLIIQTDINLKTVTTDRKFNFPNLDQIDLFTKIYFFHTHPASQMEKIPLCLFSPHLVLNTQKFFYYLYTIIKNIKNNKKIDINWFKEIFLKKITQNNRKERF